MNFAAKEQVKSWLHHPVVGDVSFDSFVHREEPVFVSRPPFEWTVNGSLFRDPKTGDWILQAGHYPLGYAVRPRCHAELLISKDEGKTFASGGTAVPPGSIYHTGEIDPGEGNPDTVIEYDPETGKYYMAYDGSEGSFTWENAHGEKASLTAARALLWPIRPQVPMSVFPAPP